MKFRYIGEESAPGSGESVVCGSIRVAVGGVFNAPAHQIGKLRNNPFFEEVTETDQPEDAPVNKTEAVAFAERAGLDIDKRWSAGRIIKELEAKAAADGQVYDVERMIKADRAKGLK